MRPVFLTTFLSRFFVDPEDFPSIREDICELERCICPLAALRASSSSPARDIDLDMLLDMLRDLLRNKSLPPPPRGLISPVDLLGEVSSLLSVWRLLIMLAHVTFNPRRKMKNQPETQQFLYLTRRCTPFAVYSSTHMWSQPAAWND